MAILTHRPRNRLSEERLRVFRQQQAQKARQLLNRSLGGVRLCSWFLRAALETKNKV